MTPVSEERLSRRPAHRLLQGTSASLMLTDATQAQERVCEVLDVGKAGLFRPLVDRRGGLPTCRSPMVVREVDQLSRLQLTEASYIASARLLSHRTGCDSEVAIAQPQLVQHPASVILGILAAQQPAM